SHTTIGRKTAGVKPGSNMPGNGIGSCQTQTLERIWENYNSLSPFPTVPKLEKIRKASCTFFPWIFWRSLHRQLDVSPVAKSQSKRRGGCPPTFGGTSKIQVASHLKFSGSDSDEVPPCGWRNSSLGETLAEADQSIILKL